jgi:hypothetical protein
VKSPVRLIVSSHSPYALGPCRRERTALATGLEVGDPESVTPTARSLRSGAAAVPQPAFIHAFDSLDVQSSRWLPERGGRKLSNIAVS